MWAAAASLPETRVLCDAWMFVRAFGLIGSHVGRVATYNCAPLFRLLSHSSGFRPAQPQRQHPPQVDRDRHFPSVIVYATERA